MTQNSFDPARVAILADELEGVHDALGFVDNFEVREPDLHLTWVECRTILRDAFRTMRAIAAAAREGGDVQQAPGGAPQSGHRPTTVAHPEPRP